MKRNDKLAITLLITVTAFPVITLITSVLGYRFVVYDHLMFSLIITLLHAVLSLALLRQTGKQCSNWASCLAALLPLLSLINLFFHMWESTDIWVTLVAAVCILFSLIISGQFAKSGILKKISIILTILLFVPVAFISLIVLFFQIGQNTVVQTAPSPEGRYYAKVIDSDQGAFGGDTIVYVYDAEAQLDLYFFEFEKEPQRVYSGEWGEFRDTELYWASEHELVIDGCTYAIK